jgi:hypothetical protein
MVLRSEIREMGGIIVAYGKGIGVRWCGGQLLGIPEELPERPACAAKTGEDGSGDGGSSVLRPLLRPSFDLIFLHTQQVHEFYRLSNK